MDMFATRWDEMVELMIADEKELSMAVALCGSSLETLDRVVYVKTGYRTFEQLMDCEYPEDEE